MWKTCSHLGNVFQRTEAIHYLFNFFQLRNWLSHRRRLAAVANALCPSLFDILIDGDAPCCSFHMKTLTSIGRLTILLEHFTFCGSWAFAVGILEDVCPGSYDGLLVGGVLIWG